MPFPLRERRLRLPMESSQRGRAFIVGDRDRGCSCGNGLLPAPGVPRRRCPGERPIPTEADQHLVGARRHHSGVRGGGEAGPRSWAVSPHTTGESLRSRPNLQRLAAGIAYVAHLSGVNRHHSPVAPVQDPTSYRSGRRSFRRAFPNTRAIQQSVTEASSRYSMRAPQCSARSPARGVLDRRSGDTLRSTTSARQRYALPPGAG